MYALIILATVVGLKIRSAVLRMPQRQNPPKRV